MDARDIMTRSVATVRADTPVTTVAALLLSKGISGVPVVDDDNRVLGMVSEGDLVQRPETGTTPRRSWWLDLLADTEGQARDYIKHHGLRAGQVMSRPVISVVEGTDASEIAALLDRRKIKRVPVVRNGTLVGIVSRADIVRALVGAAARETATHATGDRAIREALEARAKAEPWANAMFVNFAVENGTVEIAGLVRSDAERQALCVLAERVPGVKAVRDHLTVGRFNVGV